jgi:hypothetical protein
MHLDEVMGIATNRTLVAARFGLATAWARQDSNLDLTDYESVGSRELSLGRAKSLGRNSGSIRFGSTVRERAWNTPGRLWVPLSWTATVAELHMFSQCDGVDPRQETSGRGVLPHVPVVLRALAE